MFGCLLNTDYLGKQRKDAPLYGTVRTHMTGRLETFYIEDRAWQDENHSQQSKLSLRLLSSILTISPSISPRIVDNRHNPRAQRKCTF